MNAAISLVIAEALIKHGPSLARELLTIFQVDEPTRAQWERAFGLVDKSYDEVVHPGKIPVALPRLGQVMAESAPKP